ncbi:MAG TPA: hypothetical protein PKD58_09410, partial [Candidatus Sumerlaeota bacterium]|nr:hypothetical protein [Candidatus Sumerlaeota bacterium]
RGEKKSLIGGGGYKKSCPQGVFRRRTHQKSDDSTQGVCNLRFTNGLWFEKAGREAEFPCGSYGGTVSMAGIGKYFRQWERACGRLSHWKLAECRGDGGTTRERFESRPLSMTRR